MLTIDGVVCNYEPASVKANWSDYGLAVNKFTSFTGRSHTTINVDPSNHFSCIKVTSYILNWDNSEAVLDAATMSQLRQLHKSQRAVVCRIDEPLSRDYGRCTKVAENVYATPTHPIKPYNWTEDDPGSWQAEDLIVGGEYWAGEFTVDEDSGIITLSNPSVQILTTTQVHLRYRFVGTFRVISINMEPTDLSQTYYSGTVVLESV